MGKPMSQVKVNLRGAAGPHIIHTIRFSDGFIWRVSYPQPKPEELVAQIESDKARAEKSHEENLKMVGS